MHRLSPALLTALMLLSGCSGSAPQSPPEPLNDGRIQVLPLSGVNHYTEGTGSLSFEMPSDVEYEPVSSRAGPDAVQVRTWRAPAVGGDCIVIAGEQPDFRGAFPAAAIAAFAAGRERGGRIELNQPIAAGDLVTGTVAGVAQHSRYPIIPGDQFGKQGALFVRQYLTEESTLISLNAAGPVGAIESCRLAEIASTLRAGGVSS